MAITWDSIKEGDTLPEIKKTPGVTQLVKYAAGGGDFNPMHHDYNFFQSKAIGSIIVHGRFKWSSLGEIVSNWLGHQGFSLLGIVTSLYSVAMPNNTAAFSPSRYRVLSGRPS